MKQPKPNLFLLTLTDAAFRMALNANHPLSGQAAVRRPDGKWNSFISYALADQLGAAANPQENWFRYGGPAALKEGQRPMSDAGNKIETVADAKRFLFAGKAVITLKSQKTGDHITFKVKRPKKGADIFFVAVLDHADGLGGYPYLGTVRNNYFNVGNPNKTPHRATSTCAKAFDWALENIARRDRMPPACEIWHEVRCGRCGRALTDPSSISIGIGPECASKMGL